MNLVCRLDDKKRWIEIKNETISGILFSIDTAFAVGGSKIPFLNAIEGYRARIIERLDGKDVNVVFDGNFKDMFALRYSNAYKESFDRFFDPEKFEDTTYNEYVIPFEFGTNYVLKDGISLFVEVVNGNITIGNVALDVILKAESIPSIGLKEFIPEMETRELDPNLFVHDLDLGSFVHQVILIPVTGDTEYPISNIRFKSDKLNQEFSGKIMKHTLKNTVFADTDYLGTPIDLVKSFQPLHKLNIKLAFLTADGPRRIIIVRKTQTAKIVNALVKKQAIHDQENVQVISLEAKMDSSANCNCH